MTLKGSSPLALLSQWSKNTIYNETALNQIWLCNQNFTLTRKINTAFLISWCCTSGKLSYKTKTFSGILVISCDFQPPPTCFPQLSSWTAITHLLAKLLPATRYHYTTPCAFPFLRGGKFVFQNLRTIIWIDNLCQNEAEVFGILIQSCSNWRTENNVWLQVPCITLVNSGPTYT